MTDLARHRLLFYLGVPVVVGFLLGANQTGIGIHLPWWASVVFWVSCTLGSWLIFHAGTVAAAALLRPWEPSLAVKLAAGLLIASLPARLLINAYLGAFEALLADGRTVRALPAAQLTLDFAIQYFKVWSGPYVLWIATNLFFDRIVGFSRYRLAPKDLDREEQPEGAVGAEPIPHADDEGPANSGPERPVVSALLSRLPRAIGLDILAIKSEDHYLRIYTDRGEALILYRLSAAIEELERLGHTGLQVHRSYWVRREAVVEIVQDGRKWLARLRNGLMVPVSQSYREVVRKAGLEV